METAGRPAEMQFFGDRDKIAEVPEFDDAIHMQYILIGTNKILDIWTTAIENEGEGRDAMRANETVSEEKAVRVIRLRDFEERDSDFYREINLQWVRKYFTVEEQDLIALGNPVQFILEPGGCILIAEEGDRAVGCCALIRGGEDSFEVAKMAVLEECRGRGIGRKLLAAAVERARSLGATRVYLESNHTLRDAVHLYEEAGFRHVPREQLPECPYVRADVFMQMEL